MSICVICETSTEDKTTEGTDPANEGGDLEVVETGEGGEEDGPTAVDPGEVDSLITIAIETYGDGIDQTYLENRIREEVARLPSDADRDTILRAIESAAEGAVEDYEPPPAEAPPGSGVEGFVLRK